MVLGASDGDESGIACDEDHQVESRVRPYLGEAGPTWELSRLACGDGREIVFVLVHRQPPEKRPFLCHRDFQSDKGAKDPVTLQGGRVYIRSLAETRPASASEIESLIAARSPEVAVQVALAGTVTSVERQDEMLEAQLEWGKTRLVAARLERSFGEFKPAFKSPKPSPLPSLIKWNSDLVSGWSESMGVLAGAMLSPVRIEVTSLNSWLSEPELILVLDGVCGVRNEDPKMVDPNEIIPPVPAKKHSDPGMQIASVSEAVRRSMMSTSRNIRPFSRMPQRTFWENTDSGLLVRLRPDALRPGTPWCSDPLDAPVLLSSVAHGHVSAQWSLTAREAGQPLTGEVETERLMQESKDVWDLMKEFSRASRNQ